VSGISRREGGKPKVGPVHLHIVQSKHCSDLCSATFISNPGRDSPKCGVIQQRPEGVEGELRHVEQQKLFQVRRIGNRPKVSDVDAVEMHTPQTAARREGRELLDALQMLKEQVLQIRELCDNPNIREAVNAPDLQVLQASDSGERRQIGRPAKLEREGAKRGQRFEDIEGGQLDADQRESLKRLEFGDNLDVPLVTDKRQVMKSGEVSERDQRNSAPEARPQREFLEVRPQ
jgi:hypothetical protein